MNEPKDTWLVATMKFIFSLLKTGNDRMDKVVQIIILFCALGTIILYFLGMFMGQAGETLPQLLDMVVAFFQSLLGGILDMFTGGGAEVSAVDTVPTVVGEIPTIVPN